MSKILILVATLAIFITACTSKTTVAVLRNPIIEFKYDSLSWVDNSYFVTGPSKIVAYPADTTLPGKLYNRFVVTAYGVNSKGNNLQFNINFDVEDPSQIVGIYKTSYTVHGGLASAQLFNLDNNSLADYTLAISDTTSFLQIQRQSAAEMLMAGVFQLTLYNTRDTAQKIFITDGIFTDIIY